MMKFDMVVVGGGPGGYVAAIRGAQIGKKVAVVEMDKMGGVCLNRGCIPTKALLKAAHAVHEIKEMAGLGIEVELKALNAQTAVQRANAIADRVSKGIDFLMKKNEITVIKGRGSLVADNQVEVVGADGTKEIIEATNIILATGAHYRSFPGLVHDGDRLIGAWEALKMEVLPKSIAIIGAGAIGMEFAYFWNAFGVDVHIFEIQKNLLPLEDQDSSSEVERAYRKLKIKMSLGVESVSVKNSGEAAVVTVTDKTGTKELSFEKCLIAVGMIGNVENLGLEKVGVAVERGFIVTNEFYQTSRPNIYAIGDVSGPPLLAHAASHEGLIAVGHINGEKVHPLKKENVAACTYCYPQVASVGQTEKTLKESGKQFSVGKMAFRANGKAIAGNETDGFVKVLLDQEDRLLGAHIVGSQATELIHELALFKSSDITAEVVMETIHPHPTLGEWIMEAVMDAKKRALHN